jgi:hypothetical protein
MKKRRAPLSLSELSRRKYRARASDSTARVTPGIGRLLGDGQRKGKNKFGRESRSSDRRIGRHFCGMSRLLFFLRVSWVSLAGCGAGEEEVAFAGVAGKGGGAFELGAGFGVAA